MLTLKTTGDRATKLVKYLSRWTERVPVEQLKALGNATLDGNQELVKKLIIALPLNGKEKQNIRTRMFSLLPSKQTAELEAKIAQQDKKLKVQSDYIKALQTMCGKQQDLIDGLNKQISAYENRVEISDKLIDNYRQLLDVYDKLIAGKEVK